MMNWRWPVILAVVGTLGGACRRPAAGGRSGEGRTFSVEIDDRRMASVFDAESSKTRNVLDQNWQTAVITDNMDTLLVQRAFRRHRSWTDYCRQQNPGSTAPVFAIVIVGKTGEIADLHLKAAPGVAPALMSCLTGALQKWTFPPPIDSGMAVLRLVF
jgi:hypothetical protein